MRIRVLRGKLRGGAKFLEGGLRVSHLKQHDAQIVVRRGGIRSAADRLAQFGLRIRLIADRVEGKAQLIAQRGKFGIEPQRLLQQLDGLGGLRWNQLDAARQ